MSNKRRGGETKAARLIVYLATKSPLDHGLLPHNRRLLNCFPRLSMTADVWLRGFVKVVLQVKIVPRICAIYPRAPLWRTASAARIDQGRANGYKGMGAEISVQSQPPLIPKLSTWHLQADARWTTLKQQNSEFVFERCGLTHSSAHRQQGLAMRRLFKLGLDLHLQIAQRRSHSSMHRSPRIRLLYRFRLARRCDRAGCVLQLTGSPYRRSLLLQPCLKLV
jgi:hypothetical protein